MPDILVPIDFSENALAALDQALILAEGHNLSLEILHITNHRTATEYPEGWQIDTHKIDTVKVQTKLEQTVQERILQRKIGRDVPIAISIRESAMVNEGIINHMLLVRAKMIVMGTHGTSNAMERFWGSNTATMINHALFPVLTIPPHWNPVKFNEFIVAVNLKEIVEFLPLAIKWSDFLNTALEMVTLTSIPEADQEILDKAIRPFPQVKAHLVRKQNELPLWRNLVLFTADRKTSILAMFVHERTVLEKVFNYSITSRVADSVHIPLLAIPVAHK